MDKKYETKVSKFISLILRHKPEVINIELDEHGWAIVDELLDGIKKEDYDITFEDLKYIVLSDSKGRYSFSDDFKKIRANQGHSISVDVDLQKLTPPQYLYHGTGIKSLSSIKKDGLQPRSRLYVHLSSDYDTAISVGKRHGSPVVLKINTEEMHKEGYKFYLSKNNVWLTANVPVKYIGFE